MTQILIACGYGSTWSTAPCVKEEDKIKLILEKDIIKILKTNIEEHTKTIKIKEIFIKKYPQYADKTYLFDFEDLEIKTIPDNIKFNIIHPDEDSIEILITTNDLIFNSIDTCDKI